MVLHICLRHQKSPGTVVIFNRSFAFFETFEPYNNSLHNSEYRFHQVKSLRSIFIDFGIKLNTRELLCDVAGREIAVFYKTS